MSWVITYSDGAGRSWTWEGGRSWVACEGEDTINIWDHATARPSIPPTVEALAATVEEWLEEEGAAA